MTDFTFIIPHKNTPDLLQKCINSIPHSDNVQIIIVDDNSDPAIVNFKQFPGLCDKNAEVILSKESKGAGHARNIALSHAVGRWIIFADADDYMLPDIRTAMEQFKDDDSDVVFFRNQSIKIPSGETSIRGDELNRRVDIAIESGDCSMAVLYSSPCQKFIKRKLITDNNITFNEVRWGNDVVFMGKIAATAARMKASPLTIYCITESDHSIIKTSDLESKLCRFNQESENVSILRGTRYREEDSIYYWHFRTWLNIWFLDKALAIRLIPKAIYCSGGRFISQAYRAKFS